MAAEKEGSLNMVRSKRFGNNRKEENHESSEDKAIIDPSVENVGINATGPGTIAANRGTSSKNPSQTADALGPVPVIQSPTIVPRLILFQE
jgi:hypothetical protein